MRRTFCFWDLFAGAKLFVLFLLSCRLLEQIVSAKLQAIIVSFRLSSFPFRGAVIASLIFESGAASSNTTCAIFYMNTQLCQSSGRSTANRSVTPLLIEILKHQGTRGFVPDA